MVAGFMELPLPGFRGTMMSGKLQIPENRFRENPVHRNL